MARDPYEGVRHALALIPLIQAHQGITVDELAQRTGLSREQITEEVASLVMMCGVPPYAPNNYISFWIEGGRVYIRFAEQFARPVRLVLQEALALLMALRPLEAGDHPLRDAVRGLREKILSVLRPEDTKALGRMEHAFHLDAPSAHERIGQLREAMARCREMRMVYWSAHRAALTERVIRPYGMAEHGGDWYVVAHDSERDRPVTFRVDRIREAELLESEFEIPDAFDVERWRRDGDFVPKPGKTVARVLFRPEVARFAREELPRKDLTDLPDGSLLARVRVGSEVWFVSWVLKYGRGVEVLDPPELRERICETCRRIFAFYDRPLPPSRDGDPES